MQYTVDAVDGAYINVLVDWNFSGTWNDGGMLFHCEDSSVPHLSEYIVRDFHVPQGSGSFSTLGLPDFRIGAAPGYVWMRCTISDVPVDDEDWTGNGAFADGETEDYLLYIADPASYPNHREWGDAPDGMTAYPGSTPVDGNFPTCGGGGIRHGDETGEFWMFFGGALCRPSIEPGGNRGYCRVAYNVDHDDGLDYTVPYTLTGPPGAETVVEEYYPYHWINRTIGNRGAMARWSSNNLDMMWANLTADQDAYVNVMMDWNQDGEWASADEHVLQNYVLPPARSGSGLSAHPGDRPPDFRIGPNAGYVWARFTITPVPVSIPWDGSGSFTDGETEDYLLKVGMFNFLLDFGDAPWGTLTADDGAVHRIRAGFSLGDLIEEDADGEPDGKAAGDSDDDGIVWPESLLPGDQAELEVLVTADGILNGWIDFGMDSSWAEMGDHVVLDAQVTSGSNTIFIQIPADAKEGTTFARFRFSDVGGLAPVGPPLSGQQMDSTMIPIGEVEDYMILIGEITGVKERQAAPVAYKLFQNYPNPFNPSTEIAYQVASAGHVSLTIYNLRGQKVCTLVDEHKKSGIYTVRWHARDESGRIVPTGMYLYRMTAGEFSVTRKLLLLQ